MRHTFWIALTVCGLGAARAEDRVFLGCLHSHTSYSDGSGTPRDAYQAARAAGLDFLAITEHNHSAAEDGAGDRADGRLIGRDHGLYNGPSREALVPVTDESVPVEGDTDSLAIEDIHYTGGPQFILFRIHQLNEDGEEDRAWTAPIWFDGTPTGTTGTPAPADPGEARLVASRNSTAYHVSLDCLDAQRIKESNRIMGPDARSGRHLHPGCPRLK